MATLVDRFTADRFALIGRSFKSDSFQDLQQAVFAARAARRARRTDRAIRPWRAIEDAIVLPKRLSA